MQFTIEEQRAIERGELLRISIPELGGECVVVRADVYDRMRGLAREPRGAAGPPRHFPDGSLSTKKPADGRFQPADRRWNLLGMALGTAVGAIPPLLPDPVGPVVTWLSIGAVCGFFAPFIVFLHAHSGRIDQKLLWTLCRVGAGIGCLIGALAGFSGVPLPAESIVGTCTAGFFAGFIIAEMYLRRVDAQRREEARWWEAAEHE